MEGRQLDYPGGFETPAFPAGKRIVVSRLTGIAVMSVFLAIVFVCSMILWAQKSVTVHPFLVSVDNLTGQWAVVGHQHEEIKQVSATRTLQESVIAKFMRNWFLVTTEEVNTALWQSCERETECNPKNKTGIDSGKCALYCIAGDNIFNRFIQDVVPVYQISVMAGEMLGLDMASLQISPIGDISESGGMWKIRAVIKSSIAKPINILAYAKVERDINNYPQTLGYFVADFNAYKMNR